MSEFIVEDPATGVTVGRIPDGGPAEATDINSALDHLADGSAIRQIILFEEADQS
ncbi:hypothetical protein [Nocardia sp. NPDC051750]|uniref:hypothetical protein n=1 Tax=Nocardia sp. NPDC051750 TaxID=3364325 RepID=UPI00379503C4